jgi:hypothetical protein
MLRSEKCVSHFLDSAQWPDSRLVMMQEGMQLSFQCDSPNYGRKSFFAMKGKELRANTPGKWWNRRRAGRQLWKL